MSEDKENKKREQISFESDAEVKRLFNGKTGRAGLTTKVVLGRFIDAYLASDRAALAIAEGRCTEVQDQPEGEFVKCPERIRSVVQTAINHLIEMDPNDLPRMEHLIVRFSRPGYIEELLAENAKTVVASGPRAVPTKSKGSGQA